MAHNQDVIATEMRTLAQTAEGGRYIDHALYPDAPYKVSAIFAAC